jgi:hypothetical protein
MKIDKAKLKDWASEWIFPCVVITMIVGLFYFGIYVGDQNAREEIAAENTQQTLLHYGVITEKIYIADQMGNPLTETPISNYSFFIMDNGDIVRTNSIDYARFHIGMGYVYTWEWVYGYKGD